MSLSWNLKGIKDWENVTQTTDKNGKQVMSALTETLIWCTMIVDMGEITEKNWKQFWFRVELHQKLFGALMSRVDENGKLHDVGITHEDIRKHIGLTCNVHTKSYAAFKKKVMARWEYERASSLKWKLEQEENNKESNEHRAA